MSEKHSQPDVIGLVITGCVRPMPPAAKQPRVRLERWEVFEIDNGERHLIGWTPDGSEGRASSSIVEFDPVARTIRTRSGRIYQLVGPPGPNADARYVWNWWCEAKGVGQCRDVTAVYAQAIDRANGEGVG